MHLSTRLPTNIELGAERADTMELDILRSDGGVEHRNRRWSQFLREYDVTYPIGRRDSTTLATIYDSFLATGGGEDSFDFQDWRDHAAADAPIGVGDGTTTIYNLIKAYSFGARTHLRRIYRPVSAITIKRDGVIASSGVTVDYHRGVVTFTAAPAVGVVVTWSGTFNVPVRFDKRLSSKAATIHNEKFDSFSLVEVRLPAATIFA